jgi:hypothetical protein
MALTFEVPGDPVPQPRARITVRGKHGTPTRLAPTRSTPIGLRLRQLRLRLGPRRQTPHQSRLSSILCSPARRATTARAA